MKQKIFSFVEIVPLAKIEATIANRALRKKGKHVTCLPL